MHLRELCPYNAPVTYNLVRQTAGHIGPSHLYVKVVRMQLRVTAEV
jgi:hypothetical protein